MAPFAYGPILIGLFYLIIVIIPLILIIIAVFRFLDIKREQNNLLREIIKRMDVKKD